MMGARVAVLGWHNRGNTFSFIRLSLPFLFLSIPGIAQTTRPSGQDAGWPTGNSGTTSARPTSSQPTMPEFSRYFPVWTQAYVEVKGLRHRLDQVKWVWQLMEGETPGAHAVSQPTMPSMAEQFDRVLRFSLGISASEFLNDLMGEHCAIGWGGMTFRDQFGLVCRVKKFDVIAKLLVAGKAQALTEISPGVAAKPGIKVYRLVFPNMLAAVVNDHLLILGTSGRTDRASMFQAMAALAQGEAVSSLRASRPFQSAIKSMAPDCRSLFILTPDEGKPGSERKPLGLFEELQQSVHFVAIAEVPRNRGMGLEVSILPRWIDSAFWPTGSLRPDPVLRQVLDDPTDLVYASVIDTDRWYRRIVELADRGIADARQYRAMIDLLLPDPRLREKLIASLGPEMMLVVSSNANPGKNTQTRPTTRAGHGLELALVVRTSDPEIAFEGADNIFRVLGGFMTLQNLASGSTDSRGQLGQEEYRGLTLHRLSLGRILPAMARQSAAGAQVDLTWTVAGHHVIVGTSRELVHRLVDRAGSPTAASTTPTTNAADRPTPDQWLLSFEPLRVAGHLRTLSETMERVFKVVLGIGTRVVELPNREGKSVQIAAVLLGYPAWGLLQVGDVILAVDDATIDPADPQKDLHVKVSQAIDQGRTVQIKVLRGTSPVDVQIPVGNRKAVTSAKAMKLLYKLLSAAGQRYGQMNAACRYTPAGQIQVRFEMNDRP